MEGIRRPSGDLKQRTKAFALRIIRMYGSLPSSMVAQVLGKQVLRSGTSVGAHFREGTRARSNAEFVSKLNGGLQELEETSYWLELLAESGIVNPDRLNDLMKESDELTATFVTCIQNAKRNDEGKGQKNEG